MGNSVTFPSNGDEASGYYSPAPGGGPGVLVIQEWWGLVPHIRDVCDRFAAAGFSALAPDLYRGETTTEPDEAGKLMMALNLGRAAKDTSGALDWLLAQPGVTSGRAGVIGFCMGGGLAFMVACQRPDAVGALAPYYGLVPWPDGAPDYAALSCPVRGHYAGNDGFFGPDAVAGLQATLDDLGKDAVLTVHPGVDHAFFNDTRPDVYDAEVAGECWADTTAFFASALT